MRGWLQDHSGKQSWSRTVATAMILAYLAAMGYVVARTATIPDVPPMLAGLIAALYGLNMFGKKETSGG